MGRSVDDWPKHYKMAALAEAIGYDKVKHGSGTGRYNFLLFCIHNACPPDLFLKWLKARGCIKSDAWQEFGWWLRKLRDRRDCGKAWDMREGKVVMAALPEATPRESVDRALALVGEWAGGASRQQCSTLSPEILNGCKAYYSGQFPARGVLRLIHRPGSPYQLREIAIDKCTLRSQPVMSYNKLGTAVVDAKTVSLHVGPAYSASSQEVRDSGPLGTELVLEIDNLPDGIPDAMRWKWLRHVFEEVLWVLAEWHGVEKVTPHTRTACPEAGHP